ncbi:hypothetical protein [Saccharolobus islandicus]|uniref:hypothetical protein n=1 Tax=Saccharolobus islandicus TaxID=43080 RepID=UPI00037568A0|nr:hypothetical protein [Sulfolobus islandicus]
MPFKKKKETYFSPSFVDFWIINRLKKENSVSLVIMAEEYAKERNISKRSARRVLERHLKALVENGIVERLPTYPVCYKLKKLPIQYLLPQTKNFRLNVSFDLSYNNHNSKTLELNANLKQKLQESRKIGIRVITLANRYRQKALLTAQYKHSIRPGTREHSDIAFLYIENIKEWNNSVMAFENDDEEFMIMNVRTRFNDKKRAFMNVIKSSKALDNAFKQYKNAIMITLTIPHIFPLVIPIKQNGKIIGFIPLQDSILTKLKDRMMAWIRKIWKGEDIKHFTAYEYHGDYVLHIHVIVFGIQYLIPWDKKFGRRKEKEDPFTYYVRSYNISLPSDLEIKMKEGKLEPKDKTLISKYIFTALLNKWLMDILTKFGSALRINLLDAYLNYKRKEKLQGPINEIHRIKNGKWKGKPPKDSILEYSSGAAYRKILSPKQYVLKYVIKMVYAIAQGVSVEEKDQAKVYGYWLFGKRSYSYSPSLLPKKEKKVRVPYWHFVGVFEKLDIPDYVMDNLLYDLT